MSQEDLNNLQTAFVEHMKEKNSTEAGRSETLKTLMIHVRQEMMHARQQVVSEEEAWDEFIAQVKDCKNHS